MVLGGSIGTAVYIISDSLCLFGIGSTSSIAIKIHCGRQCSYIAGKGDRCDECAVNSWEREACHILAKTCLTDTNGCTSAPEINVHNRVLMVNANVNQRCGSPGCFVYSAVLLLVLWELDS
jgi:hypothetical protein